MNGLLIFNYTSMSYKISVVGATGNVGHAILDILAERNFPVSEVVPLARKSSKGMDISYGLNKILKVQALDEYDFSNDDIVFGAAGSEISEKYYKKITEGGAIFIDNASFFRTHKDVPLIVPEVNPDAIFDCKKMNIIANPNCSTIQMLVPLKPLHDKYKIKRIVVSTYQSVSGKGKVACDELYHQTKAMFNPSVNHPAKEFTKQIAFNCIPHIDSFMEDGVTKEEWKINVETKKILDESINVNATCVRVPVFNCHAESVNIEFGNEYNLNDVIDILYATSGVSVVNKNEDGGYATQAEYSATDDIYVSRIRRDNTIPNTLNLWIVSDNLRKGAALNAVQIAELIINKKII